MVTYVIQVFHVMFFKIKVLHTVDHDPRHILLKQKLVKQQDISVQYITQPIMRSGAWFAHSEAILLSLLCSPEKEERSFAVQKVLNIRGNNELGDTKVMEEPLPSYQILLH